MSRVGKIKSIFAGFLVITVVLALITISLTSEIQSAKATTVLSKMVGFNGRAWTLTEPDSNGNRYIGGDFSSYNAWLTGNGAWVNPSTGEVDASFGNVSGEVFASVPDGSGGVFIAGSFSAVGGIGRNRVAHIFSDGTLDASFVPPSINNEVWSIDIDSNNVYIGGKFSTVGSTSRNYAAALDRSTGNLNSNWNPNANSWVHTIFADGNSVYLGGRFTTMGGTTRTEIAKVDINIGAIDPSFSSPISGGYGVFDILKYGSNIYVGGSFSASQSGSTLTSLVRLDELSGTLDTSWNPAISGNTTTLINTASNPPGPTVYSMDVSGGTLYVGGKFTTVGGLSRQRLAAFDLNNNATLTSWAPTTASGGVYNSNNNIELQDAVSSLDVSSGTVYISGGFFSINGVARNRVGAISASTGALNSWDPHACDNSNGAASHVRTVSSLGSKVFVGGNFSCMGGLKRYHAAAVGPDGILTSWTPEINAPVQEMSSDGNTIYMVGRFTNVNNNVRQYAAAVQTDGTVTGWSPSLSVGLCGGGEKQSVLQTSTYIYVGGCFTTVNGIARTGLAATDPATGATISSFNANIGQADVRSLAVDSNRLYVGGAFSTVGGLNRTWIAAVDRNTGLVDSSWNPGTLVAAYDAGVRKAVHSIKIDPINSRVYIGGWFGSIGGVTQRYLAALDQTTGSLVTNWQPQIGTSTSGGVFTLSLNDGHIYFGGSGSTPVSGTAFGVADTASGSVSTWMNSSGTGEIRGIAATDAAAFVVGEFSAVSGQSRSKSAAVDIDGNVLAPWPMDASTTQPIAVNLTASGVTPGAVISSPGGINCGGACSYGFATSTTVTLTAVPLAGTEFGGWGGSCSSLSTTCTISLQSAVTAIANFVPLGAAPTATPSPTPSVTQNPNNSAAPSASPSVSASPSLETSNTPPSSIKSGAILDSEDSNGLVTATGESDQITKSNTTDENQVENNDLIDSSEGLDTAKSSNEVVSPLVFMLVSPILIGLVILIFAVILRRKSRG